MPEASIPYRSINKHAAKILKKLYLTKTEIKKTEPPGDFIFYILLNI